MKTALQELIDEVIQLREKSQNVLNSPEKHHSYDIYKQKAVRNTCNKIIKKAKDLLEKEKFHITTAYLDGDSNGCGCYDYSTEEDAEKYYTKTFNQEEK